MDKVLELISKLRGQLEACRTDSNKKEILDAIVTINDLDGHILYNWDSLFNEIAKGQTKPASVEN